jgi:hypothetical protein
VGVDATIAASPKKSAQKKWTILVYLNADNNLEDAGYEDIREMEKVGSTDDVNIVVQFDYVNPRGTKRLYVEKAGTDDAPASPEPTGSANDFGLSWNSAANHTLHSKVLEEMPEQDMGDANVFSEFITWGMKSFPADHYMIVMWNHGSGWSKEQQTTKGISYDDTSGNHITTRQLESALDEIISVSGNRIDVLAFDACLMGMVEVVDAVEGLVDFVVASEETIPWDGYPYDDFLTAFNASDDKSKEALVHELVKAYGASYSGGSQGSKEVTLSVIDVSKFEMFKRRLNTWLRSITQAGMSRNLLSDAARRSQSYEYPENKDLGDYVQNVLNSLTETHQPSIALALIGRETYAKAAISGATGASLSLLKAINETVIENFASRRYSKSMGLAIYLPTPYISSYGNFEGVSEWKSDVGKRDLYLDLKWSKSTDWSQYLDDLFLKMPEPVASPVIVTPAPTPPPVVETAPVVPEPGAIELPIPPTET